MGQPRTSDVLFPGAAFDVVGIGSSAGGLRSLMRLVGDLPEGFPCAILVVQHLDPRHRSVMHEILSRHGKLKVVQAEDGARLAAATIYMAPPNRHLLVNGDATLSLSHSELVHFVRPSADLLFESAAASFRDRAVAVVLTGTGSDGAMGAQAIKKMGGTVIVQDPEDAEFSGMPVAAVGTGCADFVLPLEEIPHALLRLVKGDGE